MKTITLKANDPQVDLKGILKKEQPLVVSFEPFVGELSIAIKIPMLSPFRALAFTLEKGTHADTTPQYINQLTHVTNAYLLLATDREGVTALLCLSHKDLSVSLQGKPELEGLLLQAKSGSSRQANKDRPLLLCVSGDHLNQTIALTMRLGLQLTGGIGKLSNEKSLLPEWLESLGWDSKEAFGTDISHDKMISSVWGMRQLGIQPSFVLINEGWQDVRPNPQDSKSRLALNSFEADSEKFPMGLKGVVDELHRAGIKKVGVWHGIMGSRDGVHPNLAKKYDLPSDPSGRYLLGYDLGRTFEFYYKYYQSLREQGISFIKVGDQNSVMSYCRQGMDPTRIYRNLQSTIQAANSLYFGDSPMNGECLQSENLFYWTTSSLASAGDGRGIGVRESIRDQLTNAFWLQYLMLPEYSPLTTDSSLSESIAMLHALSGSINMISDIPGKHNADFIHKIVLPSGRINRADKPLTLCRDSLFRNPLEESFIYKAYTFKRDVGVMIVFNLLEKQKSLHSKVFPRDVEGLSGERFSVFSHSRGFIGIFHLNEEINVTLEHGKSDILSFSPVKNGVGIIGCYPFYLPSGPITEVNHQPESLSVSTMATTPMILYCENQILEIRRNGEVIPWEYDHSKYILTIDSLSNIHSVPAVYNITFE